MTATQRGRSEQGPGTPPRPVTGSGAGPPRSGSRAQRASAPGPGRSGSGGEARAVDPRLQARRLEVARQEGVRRLWMVAGLTAVASLAIAAIALAKSSWFDVEGVEVAGAVEADPRQIVTASGIEVGRPLVEVRPGEAAEAVARVPWVADAEVRRGWRGTVTIEITERVGLVAVPAGSRHVLVDRTGRQLEILPEGPEGMLVLHGLDASGVPGQPVPPEGLAALRLMEQFSLPLAPLVSAVRVEGRELVVELSSGGAANFGDERDIDDKMVALETVLARVDLSCVDLIDVRVPSAPTVRRVTTGPVDAESGPGQLPGGSESAPRAETQEPLAAPGGC